MNCILKKTMFLFVLLISSQQLTAQKTANSDSTFNFNTQKSLSKDKLSFTCPFNVLSSLSGRFPGMQVTTPTGHFGGATRIVIRGFRSITNNNQPLIVVDGIPYNNSDFSSGDLGLGGYDMGSMANDLNLWDIDSISVLTPSNSAIYGSRGTNGVISILTKNAKYTSSLNLGVNYNTSINIEKIAIYPKCQKLYGGGYSQTFESVNINGANYLIPEYSDDESWGPKFDPNISVLPWNAFDSWDSKNYMKAKPWVYPANDYTSFFRAGNSYQNNIQVNGSYKFFNANASYTNFQNSGIYPNSSQKRNILSVNTNVKVKNIVEFHIGYAYTDDKTIGRQSTGYHDNVVGNMWQWAQTSVDYADLKSYIKPDGTQRAWNRTAWDNPKPMYDDNPYWARYKNVQNDFHTRKTLNALMKINICKWLSANARYGTDSYDLTNKNHVAVGSAGESSFSIDLYEYKESNLDLFLNSHKRLLGNAIGINTMVGFSKTKNNYSYFGGKTSGGLMVENIYALANSRNNIGYAYSKSKQDISSYYSDVTIDFKNLYYLKMIARKENGIGLMGKNVPASSKSIRLYTILTNFNFIKKISALSDSKIYVGLTNFRKNETYYAEDVKINPDLKQEQQNHFEAGLEFHFFKNRIGLEISYFNNTNLNEVVIISINPSMGYNYKAINFDKTICNGFETSIIGVPIKSNVFEWNLMINLSTIHNKVVSILDGYDSYDFGTGRGGQSLAALKGRSFPYIIGTKYEIDGMGNRLISTNGKFIKTTRNQPLAKVTPDFNAGITNTFIYKKFIFSFLLDIQKGGHMYYSSYRSGIYSGWLKETAAINEYGKNIRNDIANGGGVLQDGVYGSYDFSTKRVTYLDENGKISTTPVKNKTRITALAWAYDRADIDNVFSTDYIKLREVSVSYNVPVKFNNLIKGFRVTIYGRNLAVWGAVAKYFDPEYFQVANSNAEGLESGYLPGTKTYGFALNVSF